MAIIEGFQVGNFRVLRDVTLGRLSGRRQHEPLTPFTVVIGKNGSGKSSLFDAFGFVADCLATDAETACDMKQRGGFERLRSKDRSGPINFEIFYRESPNDRPISYELAIDLDRSRRPYVASEMLKQARKGKTRGRLYPFLTLKAGKGLAYTGEDALQGQQTGPVDAGAGGDRRGWRGRRPPSPCISAGRSTASRGWGCAASIMIGTYLRRTARRTPPHPSEHRGIDSPSC